VKFNIFICISCLVLALSVQAADPEPVEVPTKTDDLEELQLRSRLEDRLARDIGAYLGHDRFMVNVDVTIEKIRQVVKRPIPQPRAQNKPITPPQMPRIRFPDNPDLFEEDLVESLPGLPFTRLPEDREKEAEIAFMREQIERLQEQRRQPTWEEQNGQNGQEQKTENETIAVFNRIKQLIVSVVVERDTSQEQEKFIRNLVYQKANLNDLRGDKFEFIRTDFSKIKEAKEQKPEVKTWFDENINELLIGLLSLLAFLFLVAIILLMRKKKEPQPSADLAASHMTTPNLQAEETHTVDQQQENKQKMQKTRQDVISLGLGQPVLVQGIMNELSQQEDKTAMLASVYKVLGRSLFRSIFPNVGADQLQAIMTHLAENTPDDEDQLTHIQDFHQIVQQKLHTSEPVRSHPFDFLGKLNDSQVLYLIQHEDARIKALVISQLPSEQGARVINRISATDQAHVISELGQFESFPVDTFKDVADRLAQSAQHVPSFENVNADGLTMLMSMLDNMNSSEEAKVLKRLKQDKPDTFYKLRQQYFTFSDIVKTPKNILSNALREVDRNYIGQAICNTPDAFKIHVLTSLTPKLKAMAREDLKRKEGRIAAQEIDVARRAIVHKLREYVSTGKLSMEQLQNPQAES